MTVSDNHALAELWTRTGEDRLVTALNERLGTTWRIDDGVEHAGLRIMVTAHELAHAYGQLAADDTHAGARVRRWMRDVVPEQTFGLRAVASDTLGVEADVVGVKCGWLTLAAPTPTFTRPSTRAVMEKRL